MTYGGHWARGRGNGPGGHGNSSGGGAGAGSGAGAGASGGGGAEGHEAAVPPTEDLMREHGVLARLLLINEEGIRRIYAGREVPLTALRQSAGLVRDFIQDYHEHLEEQDVFPVFQQAGVETDLVQVLKEQHTRGRDLIDAVLSATGAAPAADPDKLRELARNLAYFSRMYRPHKAREDTVLYPKLRQLVTPEQFAAMGEKFESEERRRFGEHGFERVVDAVARIEQSLGIYDLAQFTPPSPTGSSGSSG